VLSLGAAAPRHMLWAFLLLRICIVTITPMTVGKRQSHSIQHCTEAL
jgi:hypothetical protein